MDTKWTPATMRKGNRKAQQRKTYYNRKHRSHAVDKVHERKLEQNTSTSSEDILALKIHGLYNDNDSSSSDSGLSNFDEDYYRYKPQPIQIDVNQIIVIGNRKNIKQRLNVKHKTYRDATFSGQKLGRRNDDKIFESTNGSTLKPRSEIKADNEIKKDEGARGVKNPSNLINEKGSIFTISNGRNKTIPDIISKNLVEQRRTINEIKPISLAVNNLQGPNNKWFIPKSTEVLSNPDLNYVRYPPLQGKVVIPNEANTHVLSSIPSIESRPPKIEAQTNKSFVNNFEEAYTHLRDVIEDLDTSALKNAHTQSSESKKTLAETLKNRPGTQEMNKTVISSRQYGTKVYQDVNPVQDCSKFLPNKRKQPSLPKSKAPMDKTIANTFDQTSQSENVHIQSSHGQRISNDTPKKPPEAQSRDKIEIIQRENAPKINRQFDDRVQVSRNDPWVGQGHSRIQAENIPPTRGVRTQNFTEGDIFRGRTLIPPGNNIFRHFPDQTDVIVRQPQVLPVERTTESASNIRDENAEQEDDTHLLGEMSEGYFARLRLICCFSRT